jgi:hypothetical protein
MAGSMDRIASESAIKSISAVSFSQSCRSGASSLSDPPSVTYRAGSCLTSARIVATSSVATKSASITFAVLVLHRCAEGRH